MAVTLIGTSNFAQGLGTVVVNIHPDTAPGDLMMLAIHGPGADTTIDSAPDGTWTLVGSETGRPGPSYTESSSGRITVYYKVAGSGEDLNPVIPDAGTFTVAACNTYRGADPSDPIMTSGAVRNGYNNRGWGPVLTTTADNATYFNTVCTNDNRGHSVPVTGWNAWSMVGGSNASVQHNILHAQAHDGGLCVWTVDADIAGVQAQPKATGISSWYNAMVSAVINDAPPPFNPDPGPTTDMKKAVFDNLGYVGTLREQELQWLQGNGATSDNIGDAWSQFVQIRGYGTEYTTQQAWFLIMGDNGHVGTIEDREALFWGNGGTFV